MDQNEHHQPALLLKGLRVLLVEDGQVNQMVAKQILLAAGARVMIAENGVRALKAVQRERFELILMDIQMPEMDGFEATHHIRTRHPASELPIIAMTATFSPEEREKARKVGMNGHLTKPFDVKAVCKLLELWKKQYAVEDQDSSGTTERRSCESLKAAGWPEELSGIDVAAGIQSSAGCHITYLEALDSFSVKHRSWIGTLKSQLEGENSGQLWMMLHALKKEADLVSAKELATLVSSLKQEVHSRKTLTPQQVEALESMLGGVFDGVEQLKRIDQ